MNSLLVRIRFSAALASVVCSTALAQTTEQRLWRIAGGMSVAQGHELMSAAYEPGPGLYGAVDFVTRSDRTLRSIGYFIEYARFAYDDGAFWTTVRNANGGTGGTVIEGSAASLAAIGAVGKIGPVYGRARPHANVSVGLFRNSRGDLTMPGLNPGETTQMKLGTKSGLLAGVGAGVDFMGRRFGITGDATYQFNWSSSKLDKRFQICDGSDCKPAPASSRMLIVRLGIALVRGQSG